MSLVKELLDAIDDYHNPLTYPPINMEPTFREEEENDQDHIDPADLAQDEPEPDPDQVVKDEEDRLSKLDLEELYEEAKHNDMARFLYDEINSKHIGG